MIKIQCLGCIWITYKSVYFLAKFGCHQCSSFDNIKVLIFGAFGFKTPIDVPQIVFWRVDLTLCMESYTSFDRSDL